MAKDRYGNMVDEKNLRASANLENRSRMRDQSTLRGKEVAGLRAATAKKAESRARERKLLSGLPQRTSQYRRDVNVRNARVGMPRGTASKRMTKSQRASAMEATEGRARALEDRYAQEDANYTDAYTNLTGRYDQGQEGDKGRESQRNLREMQESGATKRTGMREAGAGERGRYTTDAATDVAGMQERGETRRTGMREAGAGERGRYTADTTYDVARMQERGEAARQDDRFAAERDVYDRALSAQAAAERRQTAAAGFQGMGQSPQDAALMVEGMNRDALETGGQPLLREIRDVGAAGQQAYRMPDSALGALWQAAVGPSRASAAETAGAQYAGEAPQSGVAPWIARALGIPHAASGSQYTRNPETGEAFFTRGGGPTGRTLRRVTDRYRDDEE